LWLLLNEYMPITLMISVIVPAYNSGKTIEGCLKSLLNQDYKGKYEIIVADDGSTDGTEEIVRKFPKSKVRLIKLPHRGPAAARNGGAKSAKGDILLFTDADCIADRSWLAEMLRPFPGKNIAGVQGAYKTKQKSLMARLAQLEIEERYKRLLKSESIDWVGSYSAGYRKKIFLAFRGFNEGYTTASGEDPDLSYKMAKAGHRLVFNPSAIVYHTHPSTLSKYFRQKLFRAVWRVRLYKRHREKIVAEAYTPGLLKLQIPLSYLFAFALLSLPFYNALPAMIATAALFFITTLPLTAENLRKDRMAGLLTPFFVTVRTLAFAIGLAAGFLLLLTGRLKG